MFSIFKNEMAEQKKVNITSFIEKSKPNINHIKKNSDKKGSSTKK